MPPTRRVPPAGRTIELCPGEWGRGGGKEGVFRAHQTRRACMGKGRHLSDCWCDFAPADGSEPTPLRFELRPAELRGGREDLRVTIPPLGGKVTFTRVLAFAFLGRSWAQLQKRDPDGEYHLEVDHDNDKSWDCRLANLVVKTRRANARKEAKRLRAAAAA